MGPQEDYIETVFTCEGDYNDPHLKDRLEDFQQSLKDLLLTDKNKLILKKVEPWNSVRVTFNIPREAALRLKQLAQQGNTALRDLGVLSVQIQDQHISMTIAGRNNERTQLVFKTSDKASTSSAPLSVFESGSSLDEPEASSSMLGGNVDATRKNIVEYLRQDPSFGQPSAGSDKFRLPNDSSVTDGPFRQNHVIPSSSGHTAGPHGPFQQLPHTGPGPGHPNSNIVSPPRSSVGQQGITLPSQPGMPLPPHMQMGPANPLASLPPPPPYPGHPSHPGLSLMNNLQKSGTSPLLVNLLKNDPAMAGLFSGRVPPNEILSQQQPPPKKKKKQRKPKEGKEGKEGKTKKQKVPGNSDGEVPIQSVPNPALSPYSTASVTSTTNTTSSSSSNSSSTPVTSVPTVNQSLPVSHPPPSLFTSTVAPSSSEPSSVGVVGELRPPLLTQSDQFSVHNTVAKFSVSSEDKMPLTSNKPVTVAKKADQESALFMGENTAGKIVNPYTGVLEPMELSDTSPVKSDSGEKVSPKTMSNKRPPTTDSLPDRNSTHVRTGQTGVERLEIKDNVIGPADHPGRQISRPLPGHPVPFSSASSSSAGAGPPEHLGVVYSGPSQPQPQQASAHHSSLESSQLNKYPVGENMQQNRYHEHFGPDIYHNKTPPDKQPSAMSSVGTKSDSKIVKTTEPQVNYNKPSDHVSTGQKQAVSSVENVGIPQDSDSKSIPSQQLLNKPLLQVKHNDVGSRPSGSPDSNGDSESSSHSITPDTGTSTSDAISSHVGAPLDGSMKVYNCDSGVGSSSERSEDAVLELCDSDFKSGHANSFDCAKTQIPVLDPLKQNTQNSKVMTVGYAVADLQKDLKNHKDLNSFVGINTYTANSKVHHDPLNRNMNKFPSEVSSVNWSAKEQQHHQHHHHQQQQQQQQASRHINNLDNSSMSRVDSINRKSPKLSVSSPRPTMTTSVVSSQESQANFMQGNPEQTMHKNKKSPRNSPRGSPRNSPRASPRISEMPAHGYPHQNLITAQEYAAHIPTRVDVSKTPPFCHASPAISVPVGLKTSHSVAHSAGVRSAGLSVGHGREFHGHSGVGLENLVPQCNMDTAALLKTFEAYSPNPHSLSQLAALKGASGFDPALLQQLGPLFQQLQQQAQLPVPSSNNGSDMNSRSPRSPNGNGPKSFGAFGPIQSTSESHSSVMENNGPINSQPSSSAVDQLNPAERDSISTNCVGSRNSSSKSPVGSSASDGQQKGNSSTSTYSRGRPSSAGSNTSAYMSESHLPPPKRLTESVQKLMVPIWEVANLPQPKSRSPSSSSSLSKSGTVTSSPQRVGSRGSGNRTPNSDQPPIPMASLSPLDIDSITPSITVGFDGPIHVQSVSSHNTLPKTPVATITSYPVSAPYSSAYLTHNPHASSCIAAAPTKTVPAMTGSILSSKTFGGAEMPNARNSAFPLDDISLASHVSPSVITASRNTDIWEPSLCNSDTKMASSSVDMANVHTRANVMTSQALSTGLIPDRTATVFSQQNSRFPLHKPLEKPRSPFSQMGLSEMLQETANLHSISAENSSHNLQSASHRMAYHRGPVNPYLPSCEPTKSVEIDQRLHGTGEIHFNQINKALGMGSKLSSSSIENAIYSRKERSVEASSFNALSSSDPGFSSGLFTGNNLQRQLSDHTGSSSANIVPSVSLNTHSSSFSSSVSLESSRRTFSTPVPVEQLLQGPGSSVSVSVSQTPSIAAEYVVKSSSDSLTPTTSATISVATVASLVGSSNNVASTAGRVDTVKTSELSNTKSGNEDFELSHSMGTKKDETSPRDLDWNIPSVETTQTQPPPLENCVSTGQSTRTFTMSASTSIPEDIGRDVQSLVTQGTLPPPLSCPVSMSQSEPEPTSSHIQVSSSQALSISGQPDINLSGSTAADDMSNCVSDDSHTETESHDSDMMNSNTDSQEAHHLRTQRMARKPRTSNEDNSEDGSGMKCGTSDVDLAPRQLRSRKRNNPSDSDNSNMGEDVQVKKVKLQEQDTGKDVKGVVGMRSVGQVGSGANADGKLGESPLTPGKGDHPTTAATDSVKSGLRARTHSKNIPADEKPKITTRESRKDVKGNVGRPVIDKKMDQGKVIEDPKRNLQNRRNRQSPSAPVDKPINSTGTREKSPIRSSRTRGRNSPSVVDQQEETQENKRTTRSARSKADISSTDTAAMNKRRRSSRDHR